MGRPSERPGGDRKKKPFIRRKVCRFCADKKIDIDYKNPRVLRYFITERGKIIPRRISGNCAKHQREVTAAIKTSAQYRDSALHHSNILTANHQRSIAHGQ